jgi:two-component system, sensor histidine kinase
LVAGNAPSLLRELAHELRDALSTVRAALDLMRLRGFAPDASANAAPRIEHGLERALATLDAFVLAEQCERGTLELAVAPATLSRLLRLALEGVPEPLRARFRWQPPTPDIEVLADVGAAAQALSAMLQRAAAACPDGTPIEVRAAAAGDVAQLRVALPSAQPLVAEEWFATYRAPPGAGAMALRTARNLMRLQQGSLELRVPEGGRAELVAGFRVAHASRASLAAESPPAATAIAARSAEAMAGPPGATRATARSVNTGSTRILMVEDNADVRRSYREALMALGYEVHEARTAEEALSTAAAVRPEIALIDINLPGMNGYRLAQALKSRSPGGLRLVMMSGVTLDDITLQLSRQAGFDQCFDKAAGPKALHALLLRL